MSREREIRERQKQFWPAVICAAHAKPDIAYLLAIIDELRGENNNLRHVLSTCRPRKGRGTMLDFYDELKATGQLRGVYPGLEEAGEGQ